jgi:hypothetical protein
MRHTRLQVLASYPTVKALQVGERLLALDLEPIQGLIEGTG